ncbi:hypothetical protein POAN111098_04805 [Polynucleobacter antarcticus]
MSSRLTVNQGLTDLAPKSFAQSYPQGNFQKTGFQLS